MEKLKLGLKSYRYFDQAKALADKLGIALNNNYDKRSPSYYTMESQVINLQGMRIVAMIIKLKCLIKMNGKKISN